MNNKALVAAMGFKPKEGVTGVHYKQYAEAENYILEVDFESELLNYGELILSDSKTTQNFSQAENWVVFECVDRLLSMGYLPQNIILEKTWPTGHGTSGRLDILVTDVTGKAYLMIECKTLGLEFTKEYNKMLKDGGQLFTYYQLDRSADFLMLYASDFIDGSITYRNEIIKIEEDYRQASNVKDLYDVWNKLPKDNGIFDSWVTPYHFVSKALTLDSLIEITQEDSSKIFNRFLEILRHNVVSDKPNAFNKIFTLFLCKIYDEKSTRPDEQLKFQWLEGIDDDISFQKRLTDLYGKGMSEFLSKKVTDFSESDFDEEFGNDLDNEVREKLLSEFTRIRLMKNNEFAIKEVFDKESFLDNGKVVKEVVELLQGYRIRYSKKQQYLSDFFELLLTTGLKQESGQFFTPVPVAQFVIRSLPIDKMIDDKLNNGEADNLLPTIIDYAAGSGHFLTESMHVVQDIINTKNNNDYIDSTARKVRIWQDAHFDWADQYIYGVEKDYRLVKVGKVGCYLHGDGIANVVHSDGLGNFSKTKEYTGKLKYSDTYNIQDNRQFDIVISNPPYSVSAFRNNARKYYDEKDFELYDFLTDQSSEIECLFIERTKQLLKDDGVAGIILPSSILNNGGVYTKTREIILKYFDIIGITELGSNTFMATGTSTVTIFLRRRKNRYSKDIENGVNVFAKTHQDITMNGVELPVSKYV
ncbi:TPA: restriction endonuclease subunit M, partial [Vibrio cholerae]|nr:restriction endonuclease subunit M [Vibrio cholerae]